METKQIVALIRGNSLNAWEGGNWNNLSDNIVVQGYCSKKNLYPTESLQFSVTRLFSETDYFLFRQFNKFVKGIFQKLTGLEQKLKEVNIAHTAEIYHYYTYQAVQAKKRNPDLRVVVTVWDNSPRRFDVNYQTGISFLDNRLRKKITAQIQEVVAGVDLFLPVSQTAADILKEEYGVQASKIQVVTPGVLASEQTDATTAPIDWASYGVQVSDEDKMYLVVNRLVKEKSVRTVIDAWKLFLEKTPSQHKKLVIIGKGEEEGILKQQVEDVGLESSVFFVPYIPNNVLRYAYKDAKALLLGSIPTAHWQEQFGYVLAEAIINHCPVISTRCGAIPDVVEDAGIIVDPGSAEQMADALRALDDLNVYEEKKQACTRVAEKFSTSVFRATLRDMYSRLSQ